MLLFLNVIYVLVAIAMVALILMQRGSGAQAGSGFGGGASGTVFGARGASSFLTKATKWLAVAFFVISLFMAWQATRPLRGAATPGQNLGVMSQVPVAPEGGSAAVPGVPGPNGQGQLPQAADSVVPSAPGAAGGAQPSPAAETAPTEAAKPTAPPAGG